jgi:hypothetical protein
VKAAAWRIGKQKQKQTEGQRKAESVKTEEVSVCVWGGGVREERMTHAVISLDAKELISRGVSHRDGSIPPPPPFFQKEAGFVKCCLRCGGTLSVTVKKKKRKKTAPLCILSSISSPPPSLSILL